MAMGQNTYGQLGDGTTTDRSSPVQVVDSSGNPLSGVAGSSSGINHAVYLKSDGTVWAVGRNNDGQLGDGTTTDRSDPVQVLDSSGNALSGVVGVSAGVEHTVFLKADGTVWATGGNAHGQLGDGTNTDRLYPIQVTYAGGFPLSDFVGVSAYGYHTVFLKNDRTVWAVGRNNDGQLGDATTTNRSNPVQVVDAGGVPLSGVVSVSAGNVHSLFLKGDGTVWAVGDNTDGQLGDGTTTDRSNPVQVVDAVGTPLSSIVAVAGSNHSVFLKSDGSVWTVGLNNAGQLGDGTTSDRNHAERVKDALGNPLTLVAGIAAGNAHTILLKSDGTVWATGNNFNGQLGDGTNVNRSNPVQVATQVQRLMEEFPPYFVSVATVSVPENQTLAIDVNASDPDGDTLVYSLIPGGDSSKFYLNTSSGGLTFQSPPDFENPDSVVGSNTYTLTVGVTDGTAPVTLALTINVTDWNDPPVFNSSATISVSENQVLAIDVNASDPEGTALVYALAGGADQGRFSIDSSTGVLTFKSPPDYEANASVAGDNAYAVTVETTDGVSTVSQSLVVNVANVNETPGVLSGAVAVMAENLTVALDVNGSDPDGTSPVYSLSGGADAAAFSINAATGILSFLSPPDYESPGSAAGNNAYAVTVRISDGSLFVDQAVSVTVKDLNEYAPVLTTPASSSAPENLTFALDVNATDADGDSLIYSLTGGADQAKFSIDPASGILRFVNPPDFEANGSVAGDNAYLVTVQADDGFYPVTQAVTVTVTNRPDPPVFTSPVAVDAYENQVVALDANATDDDGEVLVYSLAGGADQDKFEINSTSGLLRFKTPPDYENPGDADTNNSYEALVRVADGTFLRHLTFSITVTDVFRPIVETRPAESVGADSAVLKGEVMDGGGAAGVTSGFLLSLDPDPRFLQTGVTDLTGGIDTGAFSVTASGLVAGKKYYFRAYAINGEGISYGSDRHFTTIADLQPGWIGATPGATKDWWTSPWLGRFFQSSNGWVLHEKLGWVFPVRSPSAGVWLWLDGVGWLWTDDKVYPFLYGEGGVGWLYFFGLHDGTRLFYDYQLKKWRTVQNP